MLLIEKVVKLLDDFHYNIFRTYLKDMSIRSYYPMALFDVINRDWRRPSSIEQLSRDVYGEYDEKIHKKFLQLASHTFKLTGYLSNNYPDYLQHNFTKIEHLINTGDLDGATALATMIQDVAQKIDDYDSELKILNVLVQREVLLEAAKNTQEYHERIETLLHWKQQLNGIFAHLHKHFRAKGKPSSSAEVDMLLEPFRMHRKSKSFVVRIISRFCTCYGMYYLRDSRFYQPEVYKELLQLEEELEKYPYVSFPFLFSLPYRISWLKLNYGLKELNTDDVLEATERIINNSEEILFWNSFANQPEIVSLAVQLSHYSSNYLTSYQENHEELLSEDIKKRIDKLKMACKTMLENKIIEERFVLKYINLSCIYAGLLMLGNKDNVKEGVRHLEGLLISYQQTPFHPVTDTIYTFLIIGRFCLHEWGKVDETYRRYKKATNGKVVNPENDLTLHGFYYGSKWIETERKQYAKKMGIVYEETIERKLSSTQKQLQTVINYYKIPIPLEEFKNF